MKKEELAEDEQTANSSSHLLFKKTITTYSFQKATSLPSTSPAKRSHISGNLDGNQTGSSSSTSSTPILTAEPSNKKAKLSTSTHPEKPSKGKNRPVKRGIAPPEKYSHLKPLPDYLGLNLDSNTLVSHSSCRTTYFLIYSCVLRNKVRFRFQSGSLISRI